MTQTNTIDLSSLLVDLENDMPFLKVGINGFAGDGKTRTAAEIAIGTHKLIRSEKPIIIYDTEQAAKALVPLFEHAGIRVKVSKSRSLATRSEEHTSELQSRQ